MPSAIHSIIVSRHLSNEKDRKSKIIVVLGRQRAFHIIIIT